MHTLLPSTAQRSRPRADRNFNPKFRRPSYDCREQTDAVKLVVYVPGVDSSGISIEVRGPDLIVTACKPQVVRVNWQALHLENVQRDYQLRLKLGRALDYPNLQTEFTEGVLTLFIPKRKRPARSVHWPK